MAHQFLVIVKDKAGTLAKRLAVREKHFSGLSEKPIILGGEHQYKYIFV